MSFSSSRPEWAQKIEPREKIAKRKYIEGPYADESPSHTRELLYEVYKDKYPGDEHHRREKCVTTRYSLQSLLTRASMGASVTRLHNADEKEPIFELVDHAFTDGTNVSYVACSYIVETSTDTPFLFKTNKYYSSGKLRVDGRNHADRTLTPSALAAGHFSQRDMPRDIDFDSTAQAFLSQFSSSGPQRFDRPTFSLPQAK